MKKQSVVITGIGTVTPFGLGWETFWNSLISGNGLIDSLESCRILLKDSIFEQIHDPYFPFTPLTRFLFSMMPMMAGSTITVVRKQAPTPMNRAIPKEANPRNMEKAKEPKANMVVSEVRNMAFPVLAKIVRICPLPSCLQRCTMCTPSSMPIPRMRGRPITLMKLNFIPTQYISPIIQSRPKARGIMAIKAWRGF